MTELIGERELSKLKWRCRRGLLENDIFIERFFRQHEASLTVDVDATSGEFIRVEK